MVKDEKTHETFRVDHLIEDELEKLMKDPKKTEEEKKKYHEVFRSIPDIKTGEEFDKLME